MSSGDLPTSHIRVTWCLTRTLVICVAALLHPPCSPQRRGHRKYGTICRQLSQGCQTGHRKYGTICWQFSQGCETGHRKYGTICRQLRAVKGFSSHASSGPRRPALCIARIIAFSNFSSFCLPDFFSFYPFKFSASIKCRVAYTVNQTFNMTGWVVFRPDTTFAVDWVWVLIIKNRDPFPTAHHWTIQAI